MNHAPTGLWMEFIITFSQRRKVRFHGHYFACAAGFSQRCKKYHYPLLHFFCAGIALWTDSSLDEQCPHHLATWSGAHLYRDYSQYTDAGTIVYSLLWCQRAAGNGQSGAI